MQARLDRRPSSRRRDNPPRFGRSKSVQPYSIVTCKLASALEFYRSTPPSRAADTRAKGKALTIIDVLTIVSRNAIDFHDARIAGSQSMVLSPWNS